MSSAEQPTEIPNKVVKGMQIAETATNKAAKVTGYVGEYFSKNEVFFFLTS